MDSPAIDTSLNTYFEVFKTSYLVYIDIICPHGVDCSANALNVVGLLRTTKQSTQYKIYPQELAVHTQYNHWSSKHIQLPESATTGGQFAAVSVLDNTHRTRPRTESSL